MKQKRLTKKELNKIIETKKMYSWDYIVGIDNENDYICVNYLDKDWTVEPGYVVGTYGKDLENGEHQHIDTFTNKKDLIDYLVNDLEIRDTEENTNEN